MSHENNIQIKLEYVFIILTIIECNSMYILINHSKIIINFLWQILLCMLVVHSFNNISYKNINMNRLFMFIFIFSSIVILFFICEFYYYPSFPKFYIIKLLLDPILLIIYIINSYCSNSLYLGYKSLLYRFEKVVLWISVISIPFWLISSLHIPTTTLLLTSGWYKSNGSTLIPSYFDIGFVLPGENSTIFGVTFLRNTGIFAEPSMFSYVLIIALFIELFIHKSNKVFNKRTILLFILIISTASTTGIIFAALSLFIDIILLNYKNGVYGIIWILLVPLLLVVIRSIFLAKKNAYQGSSNNSYFIRSDDIRASIKAWMNHIILGNGLNNKNAILSYIRPDRFISGDAGISAGLTTVLACGGIFLFLFYLIPLLFSIFISPSIMNFSVFSILPLIFVNLQYSYLCIIIITFIWACWILNVRILYNSNS